MAKIVFKNPETAAVYDTDFENEVHIIVNCECNGGRGFDGLLSDLPPGAAMELVLQKSNLVYLKALPPAAAEETPPTAE